MRKDIYKSKRTKRTEITSWALIVVVVLALLSPFIYRKVLVRDSVTEYKELLVITKGKVRLKKLTAGTIRRKDITVVRAKLQQCTM